MSHPKLTVQEVFDKSVGGVLKQGRPALDGHTCRYRTNNGLKCAVGQVIQDDFPSLPKLVGMNPGMSAPDDRVAVLKMALEWSGVPDEAYPVLQALQSAHDLSSPFSSFWADFRTKALEIAGQFNLKTDVLTAHVEPG